MSIEYTGYCVKCKAKGEMKDVKIAVLSNGMDAAKGTCPTCGTKMCKIIGKSGSQPSTKKEGVTKMARTKKDKSKKKSVQSDEEKAAKRKARRLARLAKRSKGKKKGKS